MCTFGFLFTLLFPQNCGVEFFILYIKSWMKFYTTTKNDFQIAFCLNSPQLVRPNVTICELSLKKFCHIQINFSTYIQVKRIELSNKVFFKHVSEKGARGHAHMDPLSANQECRNVVKARGGGGGGSFFKGHF